LGESGIISVGGYARPTIGWPDAPYTDNFRYFADIYIDTTWQRVVIGDNQTYTNCTKREVQIPTAWATGEIAITVNQASFSSGTAYLFVVDSDGSVSSGHEITIGNTTRHINGAFTLSKGKIQ